MEIHTEIRLDDLTRAMIELEPTEVELSFMLGQLCLQYVGKRFQGEILHIGDKFQEMLANDLHDYYVNELKRPNYVTRLASMMKINNQIQVGSSAHQHIFFILFSEKHLQKPRENRLGNSVRCF